MPAVNEGDASPSSDAVKNVYWPFWQGLESTIGANVDFIKTAVGYYQDAANRAVTDFVAANKQTGGSDTLVNNVVNDAKSRGWIFAGALYYQLASLNSDKLKNSVTTMTWNPPNNASTNYRDNYSAASYLVQMASGDSSLSSSPASGMVNKNDVMGPLTDSFKESVNNTGDTNPLMMLQIFGTVMLVIAELLFLLVLVLILVIGIFTHIDFFVLGTGLDNPLSTSALMTTVFLVPAFYALMGILITSGALLAIYTPLLPYIYFTFGALAWMIATVEAMVAGPLVALGIISPSGQHEILGKAEPALMLLFSLFLRPSLMIFGLMAAMLLAVVACTMVNETFAYVMRGWYAFDPLSLVFILVAYVSLILAVLNKCFAVINLIPQQVMRWISGQGEAVEAPLAEMKGAIDTAAGKAGGAEGTGGRLREVGRGQEKDGEGRKRS